MTHPPAPTDAPSPLPEEASAAAASPDVSALVDSRWLRDVLRPLLIASLSTSLLLGPIALSRMITGENRYYLLLPFFFVVTLQAVYTRNWLAQPHLRWHRDIRTQLGEVMLWLVLLRLLTWYIRGQVLSMEVLRQWLYEPSTFFDLLFLFGALMTVGVWKFAGSIAVIFIDLGLRADELVDYKAAGRERAWVQALPVDRQILLEQFVELWMWGGILLVFSAALGRVRFQPEPGKLIGLRTLGLGPDLILALVTYYLIGLILLSQGRLAQLRARWHREGTPGIAQVSRRWNRYALLAILVVGLAASLLPFGSTFALSVIISAIIQIVVLIYFAIFALITVLVSFIMGLFGSPPPPTLPPPEPTPTPTPPIELAPTTSLLPPWASGAAFWIALLAVVVYFGVLFLSRREATRLWGRAWWSRLVQWWRIFLGRAEARVASLRERISQAFSVANGQRSSLRSWRFIRLGGLSPAEHTRYFYLSILRRAKQIGYPRGVSQTPTEYEEAIIASWPEIGDDMHTLTESFLLARYAPPPLEASEAARARRAWKALKRSMQKRRRQNKEES